jgi:hypothetical protein
MRRMVSLLLLLILVACSSHSAPRAGSATRTASHGQQVTAATEIRACEQTHHMDRARQTTHPHPDTSDVFDVTRFESCSWPPGKGADPDGYAVITVSTRQGPGQSEASGATAADVISGTCQLFLLNSQFGSQGDYHANQPVEIRAGGIAMLDGQPAPKDVGFYPNPDEAVILRNSNDVITDAMCI